MVFLRHAVSNVWSRYCVSKQETGLATGIADLEGECQVFVKSPLCTGTA